MQRPIYNITMKTYCSIYFACIGLLPNFFIASGQKFQYQTIIFPRLLNYFHFLYLSVYALWVCMILHFRKQDGIFGWKSEPEQTMSLKDRTPNAPKKNRNLFQDSPVPNGPHSKNWYMPSKRMPS